MTTITLSFTAPELKTITRGLSGDWGPTLHATARRLGAVVALVWSLCSLASDRWQQLVAWAQQHQLHGLARLGLPGGNYPEIPDSSAITVAPVLVVQRLAPALPPARSAANVAPPSAGIIHISDPMARAVRMVREGRSQRLAAHLCGVPRTSLQRALKA
jgi:hypothetical protein